MKSRAVFLVVALVVLVGVGYIVLTQSKSGLREDPLQIIVGNFVDAKVYEISKNALQDVSFSSGNSVTSRSRRKDIGSTMTIFKQPDEVGNTLILETATENRFLDTPFGIKDRPALSFSGSLVAYAMLDLPPGTLSSENVSDWRINVLNIETGEVEDLGVGYAPYFVSGNPDVVLFSSPEGIVSVNLQNKERRTFESRTVQYITHAAHASPDGAYLAIYNDLTTHYSIFEVQEISSLQLNPIGEIPEKFDTIALSNAMFYGVHRDEEDGSVTLWQYPLDTIIPPITSVTGDMLYTFDEGVVPYQIIP